MLVATRSLDGVAEAYVVERLLDLLMTRNAEAMDFLNKQSGAGSMRLANALADWHDVWEER
jgi:hypothetical protein